MITLNRRSSGATLLRTDPSRTLTLRKGLVAALRRAFSSLKGDLLRLITVPLDNRSATAQIRDFQQSLTILIPTRPAQDLLTGAIRAAWAKGVTRTYTEVKRVAPDPRNERPEVTHLAPVLQASQAVTDNLALLRTKALADLSVITGSLEDQLGRAYADALVRGLSITDTRAEVVVQVDKALTRLGLLAHDCVVRAHAEGQLDCMEFLAVPGVSLIPEWTVGGGACPQCKARAEDRLTIRKARGVLPYHPNCTCAWKPATPNSLTANTNDYFVHCPRDAQGHCLPSGATGHTPEAHHPAPHAPAILHENIVRHPDVTLQQEKKIPKENKSEHVKDPAQREALKTYTGNSYFAVNSYLRGTYEKNFYGTKPTDAVKEQAAHIQATLTAAPQFKEPVYTWRGVNLESPEKTAHMIEEFRQAAKDGTWVQFKGFQSTSLSPTTAMNFGHKGVVFEIAARKGLYLEGTSSQQKTGFKEHELLLPHDSKFTVHGVKLVTGPAGSKIAVIQLEQHGEAKATAKPAATPAKAAPTPVIDSVLKGYAAVKQAHPQANPTTEVLWRTASRDHPALSIREFRDELVKAHNEGQVVLKPYKGFLKDIATPDLAVTAGEIKSGKAGSGFGRERLEKATKKGEEVYYHVEPGPKSGHPA